MDKVEGARQVPNGAAALAAGVARVRAGLSGLSLGEAYDPAAPAAIVAAGLHLAPLPVEHGGFGIGPRDAVGLLATLAAIDGSTALGFAMHVHVVGAMVDSPGWPAGLRERLYRSIREEGALLNAAATEDSGGSPARGALPATTATLDESGDYLLTGEKSWTTWLPALRFALVSARMEAPGGSDDARPRIGLFVVDLEAPGVSRLPGFEALGMRGSASGRLRLEGVRVPASDLAVERRADKPDPRGPSPAAWFGLAIAGVYLGVGEGARDAVVKWAIDRRPGDGSTSVAELPTVQLRLGRIDTVLRAARVVAVDVAGRWERTLPSERAELMSDVALAKLSATNAAATATDEALRIAGGPGFLAGPLERAFRDARAGLINPPLEDVALAGFARTLIDRARTDRASTVVE
jgi:alkylation response protein AidB-like acyl-CoA dehydrogenase